MITINIHLNYKELLYQLERVSNEMKDQENRVGIPAVPPLVAIRFMGLNAFDLDR